MIRLVGVVVPARNEQELIGRCLESVLVAAAAVDPVPVATVVVADRCTDRTAEVARALGVEVVLSLVAGVGAARRTGIDAVVELSTARGIAAGEVWIATTDADSVVPPHWLAAHLSLEASGGRLVVGRVVPEPGELEPAVLAAWHERHPVASTEHVHGANLACRLDCYQAVGGFSDLTLHEDHDLVAHLRAARVEAVTGPEVVTSARLRGRVSGGFASYLHDLQTSIRP